MGTEGLIGGHTADWWKRSSGGLNNVYPEFYVLTLGRYAFTKLVGSAVSSAVGKGRNIVGTNYNGVLPTQDWIDPAKVAEYKALLQSGKNLDPIIAYRQGGRIFIENGHHRFVAYMELGLNPNMIIRNTGGPIGFYSWLGTTFQTLY